jgi:hypothetical protein
MSSAWIMIPLLQILSAVILIVIIIAVIFSAILSAGSGAVTVLDFTTLVGLLIGFSVASFILSIFFSFMLYRLVRRRNTHFIRQLFLYEDLEKATKEIASKKGVDVSFALNNLERLRKDAQVDETQRDPILWSFILVFAAGVGIPSLATRAGLPGLAIVALFAQYYVYYFLMKEWFRHERREDFFFDELFRLMTAVGISISRPPRYSPIPDRSFAVYVVLTIVTLGFFGIYWVHVLLSDPNNHFQYQSMLEDAIVAHLTALSASPSTVGNVGQS